MNFSHQATRALVKLILLSLLVGGGSSAWAKSLLVYSPGGITPSYGDTGYVGERDALLGAEFSTIDAITTGFETQTLANYDAVMIEIPSYGNQGILGSSGLALLNTFVEDSNKRLLLFGEQGSWATWNTSITSLDAMTSGATGADLTILKNGVSKVKFASPGQSPVAGGTEVFAIGETTGANNGITNERFSVLWGANGNVLTIFDQSMFNQWSTDSIAYEDNRTYMTNIAAWLAEDSTTPTPLNKKDVVASVKAWSNISSKWASGVSDTIDKRLNWLSRNKNTRQTSHQGIKIHFENEVIEAVMNTTPRSKASIVSGIKNATSASKAVALLQNTEGALVASADGLKTDTQAIAINEAARLRADVIGTLNPTFGTVINDWSVWTAGQVTVGDIKATSTASKQELDSQTISIGLDKPYNTNDLVGVMLSLGKSNADIGTSTTKVESDNYALSSYGVFKQENDLTIETVLGLGHLKFDTTRKDGTDNLKGKRNANQVFASATLRDKAIEHNNWSISPYGKLALAHTTLNSFSESGGATALTFDKQTINDAKVFIGADMNYLVVINNGTIKPFVKLEYGADVSDSSSATMHYNSESTNYTLDLEDKATSNWKLGLGADLITKDGLNGSIAYRREQAINTGHSDSLSFDVELKF